MEALACASRFGDNLSKHDIRNVAFGFQWFGRPLLSLSRTEFLEFYLTVYQDPLQIEGVVALTELFKFDSTELEQLRKITTRSTDMVDIDYLAHISKLVKKTLGVVEEDIDLLSTFPIGLYIWLKSAEIRPESVPETYFAKAFFNSVTQGFAFESSDVSSSDVFQIPKMYGPQFLIELVRLNHLEREEFLKSDGLKSEQTYAKFARFLRGIVKEKISPLRFSGADLILLKDILQMISFKNASERESLKELEIDTLQSLYSKLHHPDLEDRAQHLVRELFKDPSEYLKSLVYPLRASVYSDDRNKLQRIIHAEKAAESSGEKAEDQQSYSVNKDSMTRRLQEFVARVRKDIEQDPPNDLTFQALTWYKSAIAKSSGITEAEVAEAYIRILKSDKATFTSYRFVPEIEELVKDPELRKKVLLELSESNSEIGRFYAVTNWYSVFESSTFPSEFDEALNFAQLPGEEGVLESLEVFTYAIDAVLTSMKRTFLPSAYIAEVLRLMATVHEASENENKRSAPKVRFCYRSRIYISQVLKMEKLPPHLVETANKMNLRLNQK